MTPPLFFRVTEASSGAVHDRHWVELAPRAFTVDRSIVRSADVSRSRTRCVLLRPDPDEECWELRNRAPGRLLIAYSGAERYELKCDMAVLLREGLWTGTLTDAFSFAVSSRRPAGIVRDLPRTIDTESPTATRRRARDARAAIFLGRHVEKKHVLAHLWRQHLGHTTDVAEDLSTAEVAAAFGITDKTVSAHRSALAEYVFGETGHQQAVRDLVVKGGLLTWADVALADRERARLRGEEAS